MYVIGPLGVSVRALTASEELEAGRDAGVREALGALAESFCPGEAVELLRPGTTGR